MIVAERGERDGNRSLVAGRAQAHVHRVKLPIDARRGNGGDIGVGGPHEPLAGRQPLAAGLDGIEKKLALEPVASGDVYHAGNVREIPKSLGEAAAKLSGSKMLRAAFGDGVVDHYTRAATWEIEEQNRVVTDWEVQRGLERS